MYDNVVIAGALVEWQELNANLPEAEQPTPLQILRLDLWSAMKKLSKANPAARPFLLGAIDCNHSDDERRYCAATVAPELTRILNYGQ